MRNISLLPGINVSGKKKVSMKDLKALYASLDFENVVTYNKVKQQLPAKEVEAT